MSDFHLFFIFILFSFCKSETFMCLKIKKVLKCLCFLTKRERVEPGNQDNRESVVPRISVKLFTLTILNSIKTRKTSGTSGF